MPLIRWLVALALIAPSCAWAQNADQAEVVANCGTPNGTYPTGQKRPITQDTTGRGCGAVSGTVTVTPSTATHVQSGALAANLVVNAAAAHLASFEVSADSTLSAAAWWLLIFDAASAPVDGAVTPAKCYAYPAGTTSANYGFSSPLAFTTGIVLSVSTTGCFSKTASTHAFLAGDYQ